ncbi:MAG: DUF3794 domain-containing protein [Mycobacterium leprae]
MPNGTPPTATEVATVIGVGSTQKLVCEVIPLPHYAEEIKQILKTVIIDNVLVVFDKVIFDGRLRKDIMYKHAEAGFLPPGSVHACKGITETIHGPILDLDVDIAFNGFIEVPGALPGDRVEVLQAFVEGEKEEPTDICPNGAFKALIDKSIVLIGLKVVRDVVIASGTTGTTTMTTGTLGTTMGTTATTGTGTTLNGTTTGTTPNFTLPTPRSTGLAVGGTGLIPAPRRGAAPDTWIGPTLLFIVGVTGIGRAPTFNG